MIFCSGHFQINVFECISLFWLANIITVCYVSIANRSLYIHIHVHMHSIHTLYPSNMHMFSRCLHVSMNWVMIVSRNGFGTTAPIETLIDDLSPIVLSWATFNEIWYRIFSIENVIKMSTIFLPQCINSALRPINGTVTNRWIIIAQADVQ